MRYIYTKEYYSAPKKNEILSSAATWMELEIIALSEVSQTKTNNAHVHYIWTNNAHVHYIWTSKL